MIDKTSPTSLPTPFTPPSSPRTRSSGFAVFIATLSFVFTLIGIGAGYRHWQRMHDKLEVVQEQVKRLNAQLALTPTQASLDAMQQSLQSTLKAQHQETGERLKNMILLESQTRQFADTVASQMQQITQVQGSIQQTGVKPNSPPAWQLAEIQFLLLLANRELTIAHNKNAALAALKEADKLLVGLGSVAYFPVRQQLARDIGAVEDYQELDINKLYSQINELRQALVPTHIPSQSPQAVSSSITSDNKNLSSQNVTDFGHYTSQIKELINESFIITDNSKPLDFTSSAEVNNSRYQLLLLRIETLQLLLLQNNPFAFQQQLKLVDTALRDYYPSAQAAPLLVQLQQLKAGMVESSLPDISSSLRYFLSVKPAVLSEEKP